MTATALFVAGPGALLTSSGTLTMFTDLGNSGAGTIAVANHGAISVADFDLVRSVLSIDPTGSVEVGAGTGVAGVLNVDSVATLAGQATVLTPIIDDGTILVRPHPQFTGGEGDEWRTVTLESLATGSGVLDIGNAALTMSGTVSASPTIDFDHSGTLSGTSGTLIAPAGFGAAIAGFGVRDTIEPGVSGVTGVNYTGTSSGGTLALTGGGQTLDTLHFAGDYMASQFLVLPGVAPSGGDAIVLATNRPTSEASAPAGSGIGYPYTWISPNGGPWADAGNWQYTTNDLAAVVAPGSLDNVTIENPTSGSMQVITGDGNAGVMTIDGGTALSGKFSTAAITLGSILDVLAGATLTTGSISQPFGGPVSADVLVGGTGATWR
jgi:hypothetical protein